MALQYRTMEQLVGFFLVLTILIGMAAVVLVGRGKDWFEEHNLYRTSFDEGYYIKPGARIKLFKIDIGKVTEVRLTEENRVDVTMKILAQYASKIREDSVAKVESPTFIGSEYISISPGSPQKAMIPQGGTIASVRKESIADYVKQFELDKKSKAITEILQEVQSLMAQLGNPEKGVPALLRNMNQMVQSLQDSKNGIPATMANLNGLIGGFNDPKGEFKTMVSHFSSTSKRLEGVMDQIDGLLDHLNRISQQIANGEGTAGRILMTDELHRSIDTKMDTVGVLLEDLKGTTSRLPAVMEGVDRNLKELDRVLKGAGEAMAEVPGVLQKVNDKLDDVGRILDSVQKNFLIRAHLPEREERKAMEIQTR